jgi:hypothetical protein
MRFLVSNSKLTCITARDGFSAYLDGQMSGLEMASIAAHLDSCRSCQLEFAELRAMQAALSEIGPTPPPMRLQARLRAAIAQEKQRDTHLPFVQRCFRAWQVEIAPMALRATGAVAIAMALVAGLSWMFAAPLAVEANDEKMANLTTPRYLYSSVPPRPLLTKNDAPVLVEAQVDARGRVYDFTILAGPTDAHVKQQVAENLLGSIFKPAEAFGTPVNGHVMLTFSGISVHG